MNTTFWGPSGWKFLHTLTFIYPENPNFNEKVKMREFMNLLSFILPCKYCRLSFSKYIKSLPIDDYLDSRTKIIEWLYKIHNKINKKLRIQGFCKHQNPDLNNVYKHYEYFTKIIYNIINDKKKTESNRIKDAINYICNLGKEFLGSIVFNYQGYFTNCHTSNEKIRIVSVYNTFFNSIIPMLCSYLAKFCKDSKDCVSIYKNNMPNFNIRSILTQNEPYTKLVKWFYNCDDLCTMKAMYNNEEDYEKYFRKHVVMSCNNPKINNKNKTIKSCRNDEIRKSKSIFKIKNI